ncbi:MAG TPA: trehalose-6-phosphate synthase [Deltaproteobacteria bacterium]|jgi:trehalose 6-phosphate synthase|nr:trehalose-6-phosphate synthase [Deltaproteobacteria bacterium]HON60963.1 trehalose-6-phosphate synthase [Deltaproteobacteria bacterium]HOS26919.1 trehalose-6-phosphate synthase [Deltaproteobacteria bacterium]HPL87198.1 trehalose-6-phosphate synthase [Deltaproteobacteria bacterium]HPV30528.1 trehalose-6-phosphate synthase [Deltaproteobacteria bacterium]
MDSGRLVVVSNRLPVVIKRADSSQWQVKPGSGGLVTAMGPVLKHRGGLWIGWLGIPQEDCPAEKRLSGLLSAGTNRTGYSLRYVHLCREEIEKYYHGFSNEILWPLFHDLFSHCNFDPMYWETYQRVNRKFAEHVMEHTRKGDYLWVHDYQLILVARELRRLGLDRQIGFFLHIPFPPLDIFLKLPWRFQILEALLQYDLIGFQTARDRRNFIGCVRALLGCRVSGRGQVNTIQIDDRQVLAGSFPISIDYREFADFAKTQEVADQAWIIHANLPRRQIILGVDRLDYTKGIPQRLMAFENALARYPEMRRKVTLLQVVVPSRQGVEEYEKLRHEIERLVGEINGRYTEVGWTPVHYIFRSLPRKELVAYYRTCEIALVTPLKDGMNLVAKEYCASSTDGNGVLILSEFAGAAAQFYPNALLVNPYDLEGVADAIYRAVTMDQEERRARMRLLQASIQKYDIVNWVNSFLRAGISKDLNDFPQMEFFVPKQ